MSPLSFENQVISIVDRVLQGFALEDDRVELKREWPEPQKAARQIAGHANRSSPEDLVWVIGVDEKKGVLATPDSSEFSAWWAQIERLFDQICPDVSILVVPLEGESVVALKISTDRAPYVVKNPKFNTPGGGPVELEVPWREANRTRSARRNDLVKLASPLVSLPDAEIVCAAFQVTNGKPPPREAYLTARIYVTPTSDEKVVFPAHKCKAQLRSEDFEAPDLRIFYFFADAGVDDSRGNRSTRNELILNDPGIIDLRASAPMESVPDRWPNIVAAVFQLQATRGSAPLVLPVELERKTDIGGAVAYDLSL